MGITCIAVPVFDGANEVVAAVSLTGPEREGSGPTRQI
jgi:DNA-binding IclR family transcriptional regulator